MWKAIPNFSRYEISTEGQIRSLNYRTRDGRKGSIRVLSPALAKDGYLQTMMKDDSGKYKSWKIHKWMAITFLGLIPGKGRGVNHKNGVKIDNQVENLELVTRSENILHAVRMGLLPVKRGEQCNFSKLKREQVIEIRKIAAERGKYYNRKQLAQQFGVTVNCIKDVVIRRRNCWADC